MRIIKQGTVRQEPTPWYLAQEHHCPRCGALWTLAEGDDFTVTTERCPNGDAWVEMSCPTDGCNTIVTTHRRRPGQGGMVGTRDA